MLRKWFLLAGLAVGWAASAGAAAQTAPPGFQLPIECQPGGNCWIANYVDALPGKGYRDYTGGIRSYDDHKGTDFAIRDLKAMAEGVPVLAAQDGVVAGIRDSMPDTDFRKLPADKLKGRECGNGVLIRHDGGWSTQYCHLRNGSVAVQKGQMVKAGERLGLVGLSGRTQFPHLHFQIRLKQQIVDPFAGPGRSGAVWSAAAAAMLEYRPAIIYVAGLSTVRPNGTRIRNGELLEPVLKRPATTLYAWMDIFTVRNGDWLSVKLFQDGRLVDENNTQLRLNRDKARLARWVGFKFGPTSWPAGKYRAEVTLIRIRGKEKKSFTATAEALLQ